MKRFTPSTVLLSIFVIVLLTPAPARPGNNVGTAAVPAPPLPEKLSQTGLFVAGSTTVRPDVLSYSPQYPLWSDGAAKRRWLRLPPGTTIDASRVDAWEFPAGTRLWKEFSKGKPVETRLIERLEDGSWRYATYVWDADGKDALLAPAAGIANHRVAGAPGGRYPVPSRDDCLACHEGSPAPVLGVTALQLSPDRDLNAVHSEPLRPGDVDLYGLYYRGLLSGLSPELLHAPPRIEAPTPTARSALGYLHANCGHCHNGYGPLNDLRLNLMQTTASDPAEVAANVLYRHSEFQLHGKSLRVVPGAPQDSVLALRMRSRNPVAQMPPLGSRLADMEGVQLVERWIEQELTSQQELIP